LKNVERLLMRELSYVAPRNLDEAIEELLKFKGRARVIAGGTNFIPDMRSGTVAPGVIIDLSKLRDLSYIKEKNGIVSIGALATMFEIATSEVIRNQSPILSLAARRLGNPLTRNRATVGGNLAHASPAADTAPPLLAMEASVHIRGGSGGSREIPLDQFFRGPNQTVLEEDEIITEITFAKKEDPTRSSHFKLGLRNAMAISVVSIAVMIEMDGKVCRKARVALGAVAPKAIRAYRVEGLLSGKEIDSGTIDECAATVRDEISPIGDIRASAEYRKTVTSVLLQRAIREALA
jgi:carbon-monoxide dehydrogenase medium subunit